MSSESLLQLVEAAPQPLPIPSFPERAAPDTSSDHTPAAAVSRASPSLRERRLQAARDLNTKIGELEQEILQLNAAMAESQHAVGGRMKQMQQRAVAIMADVMRLSIRLEKSTRQQGERTQALDHRLSGSVNELGKEVQHANTMLQSQQECLHQLQDNHDALGRLHSHLEKVTQRQGQSLGILAADTRQRFQILQGHIEELGALHRTQQEALLALSMDHEMLAIRSGQLEEQLQGLDRKVDAGIARTRRRLRTMAVLLALLAAVSLGLIAYFQLYPSAVPDSVRHQLLGLTTGLHKQSDDSLALRGDVAKLDGQAAGLAEQLARQRQELANLRRQYRQLAVLVRQLQATLAAPPAPPAPSGPSVGATRGVSAQAIPLPQALPGTRAF